MFMKNKALAVVSSFRCLSRKSLDVIVNVLRGVIRSVQMERDVLCRHSIYVDKNLIICGAVLRSPTFAAVICFTV